MEGSKGVMEGRRRPAAGKRLARLAHKLRHVVTKLAPEVGPLVREASGEAGRLVREAACLLGCRGNVEEEPEPEASKLTERERESGLLFVPSQTDSSSSDSSQLGMPLLKNFNYADTHYCLSRCVKVK